ncbi:hypothetical protein BT96DRAFT_1106318 [Gymnopus androsaceus JB14]|uniref:Uncharacterized protein n=1 Tax=Gymnopus androsaceus JB14 TaxID=1447944 RepID=A0A6A4GDY4_9AGAR|nr:hypothetical protein BT96DRAFT_1106318 [Gymnopus androsaceus JB14]
MMTRNLTGIYWNLQRPRFTLPELELYKGKRPMKKLPNCWFSSNFRRCILEDAQFHFITTMHFTPTFLPVLIHALVSVARAVPLHANAGLGDLAIRAPTQDIQCAVTNQQSDTSIAHDEAQTPKMVQWVFQDKDVMKTVLGSTNTPQITYPNPYPYDIKKPQLALTTIYQSIAEVSGVRLSYLQIVGCKGGSSVRNYKHPNSKHFKSTRLTGTSRFPIKGTPKLIVAVNNLAKSSVRWLFEQPEMIAKFGSLSIAFLNGFPLERQSLTSFGLKRNIQPNLGAFRLVQFRRTLKVD